MSFKLKLGNGVDLENISRFSKYDFNKDKELLSKIFSEAELKYCFSKKFPPQHLAVRFCAKEAAIKAICSVGGEKMFLNKIEIVKIDNYPYIKVHADGFEKYNFTVSMTHTKDHAAASVVVIVED